MPMQIKSQLSNKWRTWEVNCLRKKIMLRTLMNVLAWKVTGLRIWPRNSRWPILASRLVLIIPCSILTWTVLLAVDEPNVNHIITVWVLTDRETLSSNIREEKAKPHRILRQARLHLPEKLAINRPVNKLVAITQLQTWVASTGIVTSNQPETITAIL